LGQDPAFWINAYDDEEDWEELEAHELTGALALHAERVAAPLATKPRRGRKPRTAAPGAPVLNAKEEKCRLEATRMDCMPPTSHCLSFWHGEAHALREASILAGGGLAPVPHGLRMSALQEKLRELCEALPFEASRVIGLA
jgi:hypothetical protein